jgi:hypothetical protein
MQKASDRTKHNKNKSTVRCVSLALHDMFVSSPETVRTIEKIRREFKVPLTVHLVCDVPLSANSKLSAFIKESTRNGALEIVYHGVMHSCERKAWRLLSWYHKYQAEYIVDSDNLRKKTRKGFTDLSKLLGEHPGLCPPCWIGSEKNLKFLDSLNPLYREELLHVDKNGKNTFSTVISFGSARTIELIFLGMVAALSYHASMILRIQKIRIAIHPCDITVASTMKKFHSYLEKLKRKTYQPVLLKHFII